MISSSPTEPAPAWPERRAYWRRRLGRLMLDAEPLEEQLARYRRVTWGLTVVPLFLGSILFGLLTAFRAPLVGAVAAGVLFIPIVALAWFDYLRLARRVARYEEERRLYEDRHAANARRAQG